jgi:hypothetical protein
MVLELLQPSTRPIPLLLVAAVADVEKVVVAVAVASRMITATPTTIKPPTAYKSAW